MKPPLPPRPAKRHRLEQVLHIVLQYYVIVTLPNRNFGIWVAQLSATKPAPVGSYRRCVQPDVWPLSVSTEASGLIWQTISPHFAVLSPPAIQSSSFVSVNFSSSYLLTYLTMK